MRSMRSDVMAVLAASRTLAKSGEVIMGCAVGRG